ncbi:uncharacterized protein LOC110695869 [Chenopodium quinoa]|uniref:uncharacterized protein LOC110695869 n=1 Tax=Chenopodium quinoa TaxID=63459 RepID=UPI000B770DC8|nr:uncharacterized protein LOC110695869 [Chenopodium quinoa]
MDDIPLNNNNENLPSNPNENSDPISPEVGTTSPNQSQIQALPLPQLNPSMSFGEAVKGSSQWFSKAREIAVSSLQWEEEDVTIPDSACTISFAKETLEKLRNPWKLTLMGKCLGISVRPSFITQRVCAMWEPKGTLEIIDLGKDVYLFRFYVLDDYERALLSGPWFILDHYLMITKWKPNFRPSMNPFNRMTVWIRFPELPVEYYDKDALFEIAKIAGNPIKVDYATDHLTRARYARFCIDIDLTTPLVTAVWVSNGWQQIEYENIHSLCFKCGIIGHQKEKCQLIDKGKQPITPPLEPNSLANNESTHKVIDSGLLAVTQLSKPSPSHVTPISDNPLIQSSNSYGPWLIFRTNGNGSGGTNQRHRNPPTNL